MDVVICKQIIILSILLIEKLPQSIPWLSNLLSLQDFSRQLYFQQQKADTDSNGQKFIGHLTTVFAHVTTLQNCYSNLKRLIQANNQKNIILANWSSEKSIRQQQQISCKYYGN